MFSVIIPVYNKLPHLDRSVQSVLNQTYSNFELILVDDASTDGSREKLRTFSDERIKVYYRDHPGAGGYAARNLGIEKATYDWISFLDADDEWTPDYLLTVSEIIKEQKDAELISVGWEVKGGDMAITSTLSRLFDNKPGVFDFLLSDYLTCPALVWTSAVSIKKALLQNAGNFPANGPWKNGGDVDTWIRCLEQSKKNIRAKKILAFYYRDAVNRVTDYTKNKTDLFCAYDNLIRIYTATKNSKLKKAIKTFTNKNIYNIISRQKTVNLKLVSKMFLNGYSLSRVIKIILKKKRINARHL